MYIFCDRNHVYTKTSPTSKANAKPGGDFKVEEVHLAAAPRVSFKYRHITLIKLPYQGCG